MTAAFEPVKPSGPLGLPGARARNLRRSMAQHIAADVRNAILTGQIPAGTKLNQLKLAERLEVSTTPIREALRLLEAQGLVQIDPYTGATVPVPTLDDLTSLYQIRLALCPLVARSVVGRATEEQLARAHEANQQLAEAVDDSGWLEANQALHAALDEAIGDSRLAQLWQELSTVSAIYVKLSLPHRSAAREGAHVEHLHLIESYANGDAKRVSACLIEHLTNTYEGCERAMWSRPEKSPNIAGLRPGSGNDEGEW
jgi:DNA-binding GntR family transcriptional regulator